MKRDSLSYETIQSMLLEKMQERSYSTVSVIELDEKRITFEIVNGWIRQTSTEITTNTSAQHVHYIRHFLLYLSGCGYSCAIPRNIRGIDTYVPYLYSDEELALPAAHNHTRHPESLPDRPGNEYLLRQV